MGRRAIRAVCWDWNGTLLDDVTRCLRLMNGTLEAFGKPAIAGAARYRELFRFPLHEFYADAGITADEYRAAADHYLRALASDMTVVPLHAGARETIRALQGRGIRQVLASATQGPLLAAQVNAHDLAAEFDEMLSIVDAHQASKRDVIADWLGRSGLAPDEVLMIGDTNHDHEIAGDLGTGFIHFTRGHQNLAPHVDVVRIDELSALLPALD